MILQWLCQSELSVTGPPAIELAQEIPFKVPVMSREKPVLPKFCANAISFPNFAAHRHGIGKYCDGVTDKFGGTTLKITFAQPLPHVQRKYNM
jgi:hypothetical protein